MNNVEIELKELIVKNLNSNGFPSKTVSLPLEKMYEVADKRGANLNAVLDGLRGEEIEINSETDRIIFKQKQEVTTDPLADLNLDSLKSMNKDDLMNKYSEMMSQMSPEQLASIKNMYENMTAEQKEEIMKKGQEMGLS